MKLGTVAEIYPGYLSRGTIKPEPGGSHRLLQARNVKAGICRFSAETLTAFKPKLSSRDVLLQNGDIVFMARGSKNYAAILQDVPENTVAAASFFIIRTTALGINPGYLVWYLNNRQAQYYFNVNSGTGVHMPVVRRLVLERIDIPVPSIEKQRTIAKLYRLSLEELELTTVLLEKKAILREAICLRAARRAES